MNLITKIAQALLGLVFTVFGLNGFLHFLPMPPPAGVAGQFMGALFVSHFLTVVCALELIGGALLLANRYVPLALTVLGPVIANIVLFHCLMAPEGLPMAVVVTALWGLVFFRVRSAFVKIFQQRTADENARNERRILSTAH